MKHRHPFGLTTPCPQCPFRSDIPPYLSARRVREIQRSLERATFPCHETTGAKGRRHARGGPVSCAGALILSEKEGRAGQMMRIGERLGLYDRRKLDMTAPVYDSFDAMARAQKAP